MNSILISVLGSTTPDSFVWNYNDRGPPHSRGKLILGVRLQMLSIGSMSRCCVTTKAAQHLTLIELFCDAFIPSQAGFCAANGKDQ